MRLGICNLCRAWLLLLAATATVNPVRAAQDVSVSVAPGLFYQMQLFSSGSGWISTGNRLLWTENWGDDWSDITPPFTSDGSVDGVFFLPNSQGWAVVHNDASPPAIGFCSTTDRGKTWSITPFSAVDTFLRQGYAGQAEISFTDSSHGWILLGQMGSSASSLGALFATSDGGQTWTKLPFPPVRGEIFFTSSRIGWLTGGPNSKNLYMTEDAGQHWTQQSVPIPKGSEQATSVQFGLPHSSDSNHALLAVTFSNSNNTSTMAIYSSTNAGKTWQHLHRHAGIPLSRRTVTAIEGSSFIMAVMDRNRFTIRSADGMWHSPTLPFSPTGMYGIVDMQFVDQFHGWLHVMGYQCTGFKTGCSSFITLLKTDDGGSTFVPLHP